MSLNEERRPGVGPEAPDKSLAAIPSVPDAGAHCAVCSHQLTASKSVALGVGPVCRARQLDVRRDDMGRRLRTLAVLVGSLDTPGLAIVAAGVADLEDALGGGAR